MIAQESVANKPQLLPRWVQIALAFSAVYVIWGSTYLAIKFAIDGLPPFLMAGTRFLIAGTLVFSWVSRSGKERPTWTHWRSAAIVGGLLLVGGNGGVVYAEKTVPTGLCSLLVSVVPIWVALIEWLRPGGAPPKIPVIFGLALGLGGVALLIGTDKLGGGNINLLGAATVLGASFCWSAGSLYSRHAELPKAPLLATAMEMLTGGAMMLLISFALGEPGRLDLAHVSAKTFWAVGYLIIFGSIVGFSAYIWLLNNVDASRVATYAYVNPLVAVFLGWAFAGESISARTMMAAAIILAAVAIITRYQGRTKVEHDEEIECETPGPAVGAQVPHQTHTKS